MEESSVPPIDPDFEPQSRPRSCTWPLPRPEISAVKPEGADGSESAAGTPPADEDKPEPQQTTSEPEKVSALAEGGVVAGGVGGVGATPRKGSSRRNAWGNQSYADLISQAIENSPEKRLTLAQIYEWMVKTVPYFRDKGDSNSSAGWKVRQHAPATSAAPAFSSTCHMGPFGKFHSPTLVIAAVLILCLWTIWS